MRTAPKVRAPRDVPDLRAYLADGWKTTYKYALETVGQDIGTGEFWSERENTRGAADWESMILKDPSYWWVTEDMVDLLAAAEKDLPNETVLERELVPQPSGLVVFAKPLVGLDAKVDAHELLVHAILWGTVRLPPWPGFSDTPQLALGISSYRMLSLDEGLTPDQLGMAAATGALNPALFQNYDQQLHGDLWVPLGRSDWVYGERADHIHMPAEGFTMASIIEDRKRVATMWLLQAQEGIAETNDSEPSRAERRRAEREGAPRPLVRVVDVKRRAPARSSNLSDDEKRHLHVRFLVSGHWRRQAYGPGRQYRRPKWINPHWRGPDDGPISDTKKVRIWK